MHDSLFQGDLSLLTQCNDFKTIMKSRATAEVFCIYSFSSLLVEKKKKKLGFHLVASTEQILVKWQISMPQPCTTRRCTYVSLPDALGVRESRPTAGCRLAHRYVLWIARPSQGNGVWQQLQRSRHSIWDDCIQLKELSVRAQSIQGMSAAFLAFTPVAKNVCFSCPPPQWLPWLQPLACQD